jgi:hypothetical protein
MHAVHFDLSAGAITTYAAFSHRRPSVKPARATASNRQVPARRHPALEMANRVPRGRTSGKLDFDGIEGEARLDMRRAPGFIEFPKSQADDFEVKDDFEPIELGEEARGRRLPGVTGDDQRGGSGWGAAQRGPSVEASGGAAKAYGVVTPRLDRCALALPRRGSWGCGHSPRGERSELFLDPRTQAEMRKMTLELHLPFRNDWWLPIPETVEVQTRPAYQETLNAWRCASTIVFIGYGFGGGDDAFSYEDFGRNAALSARVHVLCPLLDNRDLCKQIGYALRGRGPRFRVFGQPYR